MAHDPPVGHVRPGELGDDLAHQLDVVRAPCPVVADGGGHAVGDILVDYRDGKQTPFPLVDSFRRLEHQITVVAVHQFVPVALRIVITDARHGVAVLPDRQLQQLHFGRCDDVGIVTVRHDLFHRYGPDAIYRAPEFPPPRGFVVTIHIFPLFSCAAVFRLWSARIPCICRHSRF